MNLNFEFYGYKVGLTDERNQPSDVLNWLKEDFEYFHIPAETGLNKDLLIKLKDDFDYPTLLPLFKTKMCRVYGAWKNRVCVYNSQTVLFQSHSKNQRRASIKSDDDLLLYEIAYTYILSAVGEALEDQGYLRLHGFSVENDGKVHVCFLSSGQGKSSLAYKTLLESGRKIFSDELTLIKNGVVYPFPLRIALSPSTLTRHFQGKSSDDKNRLFKRRLFPTKILIPIPQNRVARPQLLEAIHVGPSTSFSWQFFWGLGLPQMSEFLLTLDKLPKLFKFALGRLAFLFQNIVFRMPGNYFQMPLEQLFTGTTTHRSYQAHRKNESMGKEKEASPKQPTY